jgi:hypothetical protein
MEEPTVISYNVQAAQSVYIFWLIMPTDLGLLGPGLIVSLGLLDSYFLFFIFVFGFVAYILILRAGKPRGYDLHLFATLANSRRYLRPGRAECPEPLLPAASRPAPQEFDLI